MIVQIDPDVFGTESSFALDTQSGKKVTNRETQWHLGPELTGSFGDLLRVESRALDLKPPKAYVKAFTGLIDSPVGLPWSQIMPRATWAQWVASTLHTLCSVTPALQTEYYLGPYQEGARVISALQRAHVSHDAWSSMMNAAGMTVHSALAGFKPDDSGLAPPITYTRWGTRTGRLGVLSGPSILTLKKGYRGILRSRYPQGKLFLFDYVSFEAQLALVFAGRDPRADVYDEVRHRFFGGEVSRMATKIAVMALLFGGSDAIIGRKLGLTGSQLQSSIARLKDYFGTNELQHRLLSELDDESHIRNYWGRRIPVPEGERRLIVNTYIQSSAVDAALQGFARVLDAVGDDGVPLFIIHDAVLFDLDVPALNRLESLGNAASGIPGLPHRMPCRIEEIEPVYTGNEVQ